MKLVLYGLLSSRQDAQLAACLALGAERLGWSFQFIPLEKFTGVPLDADIVACQGLRLASSMIIASAKALDKPCLFFDKGYWDRGRLRRVSVSSFHPTPYLKRLTGGEKRIKQFNLRIKPWARKGKDWVLYACPTQMWCDVFGLGEVKELDEALIRALLSGHRKILLRFRPAYLSHYPELCYSIEGTTPSDCLYIEDEFDRCYLLATPGSNAAIDALLAGVPTLVLGPHHPTVVLNGVVDRWEEDRQKLLEQLSMTLWTDEEYAEGTPLVYLQQLGLLK